MLFQLILLLAVPTFCHGFLIRNQAHWNGLKVTWGFNPFTSFQSVPRTKTEAMNNGWTEMHAGSTCDENPLFRGVRYWKDNDLAVILLFDANGYIAGIQAGIPKNYSNNPNHYPFQKIIGAPFVLDGGNYYVTAYFIPPAKVCTGRSASEFEHEGTGTGLWIQNGTNPVTNSIQMPTKQADADATMWTKGACFLTMGVHYWYNTSKDMVCDSLFPAFLMYNEGVLNSFGWAFGMDITTSKRLEHPPQSSYGNFFNVVPDCLHNLGILTTLHIYLTDSATADIC